MGFSCNTQSILQHAEQRCLASGVRFTEKRRRVLTVLVESSTPLSAYDVADVYHQQYSEKIPAMSVYRMLDFLVDETLAHKLSSTNKYMACSHIACQHPHDVPQFLICKECQQVKEVSVPKALMSQLSDLAMTAGFRLKRDQFEMECICRECESKQR